MTETMLASVNALVTTRGKVGIHEVNPFNFAVGENGHLRGCATVKRTVINCPEKIEYPELITSTKLRKYMATVSQVFKLSNSQLEELARHMGHELAVHRQYYRLQEDVVELAKVIKLLLTVEKGKAHRFKGMSLDDIQLDDLDELTSSEEAPDDSSASLNCEPSPTDDSNHSKKMADPVADFDELTQEAPDDSSSSPNCEPSPTEDLNHSKNMADPVAVPKADEESSDVSDDDVSISKKKSLKKSRKRTLWNKHEKEALENMILPMIRETGKPPQKKDVLLAITRSGETLKSRDWKSIKFQSWGMLQQERRKKNQMVDQLLKKVNRKCDLVLLGKTY